MKKNVQRDMLARLMMPLGTGRDAFALHRDLMSSDPLFYEQMALWYARHGRQIAHHEAFAAQLVCHGSAHQRSIGMALFRRLDAGPAGRVVGAVHRYAPELARSMRRSLAPRRGLRLWLRARRRVGRSFTAASSTQEADKPNPPSWRLRTSWAIQTPALV